MINSAWDKKGIALVLRRQVKIEITLLNQPVNLTSMALALVDSTDCSDLFLKS